MNFEVALKRGRVAVIPTLAQIGHESMAGGAADGDVVDLMFASSRSQHAKSEPAGSCLPLECLDERPTIFVRLFIVHFPQIQRQGSGRIGVQHTRGDGREPCIKVL